MTTPLERLYPGLTAKAPASDLELLHSARAKAKDSADVKERFFADQGESLVTMAKGIASTFSNGGRLLTMGNGGSATDAAHIAVEFNHPVTVGRPALPAVHLGADVPFMTAVGNDVGFTQVFVRQLIALGRPKDALLGLSTSGNSDNLLAGFKKARELGIRTFGLAGGDGGRMRASPDVDLCVVVESPSIHRVQESHVAAYHVIWDLVHTILAPQRKGEAR